MQRSSGCPDRSPPAGGAVALSVNAGGGDARSRGLWRSRGWISWLEPHLRLREPLRAAALLFQPLLSLLCGESGPPFCSFLLLFAPLSSSHTEAEAGLGSV